MSPYPVGYECDFAAERSRLTTFFRYLLLFPLYIAAIVYGIGLYIAVIISWFALMFTGRYPAGLYDYNAKVVRFMGRVTAYGDLATDAYPPFDLGEHPEYPVRIPIAPPKESYSRLKVFFRFIVGIPVMLIGYGLGIVAGIAAFIAWFVIMFTGKQNDGLQNAINLGVAYSVRSMAYFVFLTEDWPPFSVEGGSALGPATPDPPAPDVPTG